MAFRRIFLCRRVKKLERIDKAWFTPFPCYPSNYLFPILGYSRKSRLTTSFETERIGIDWARLLDKAKSRPDVTEPKSGRAQVRASTMGETASCGVSVLSILLP
jgi:hypothetical protein